MAPVLGARGVTVEVVYLRERPGGLQRRLTEAGIDVTSLSTAGGRVATVREAFAIVRRRRPDVIHTSLTEANLLGRLIGRRTGIPVVSTLTNVSYGPEQLADPAKSNRSIRVRHAADLLTSRQVARFHAVTSVVADVMAPRLRIPRERIDVIPRGRSQAALGRRTSERREQARGALGIGPDQSLVLAAARQDYQKGLDVLLEAMPAVLDRRPATRLVIAGRPGPETPKLEAAVDRLGLQDAVRFLGLRTDVADLLCGADVFVMSSRWEGMGGVLLEAMALEAPIVASDLATLRDALPDEGFGRFATPGRRDRFAAAILATLSDPAGSARRAADGRRRFTEHFTIERVSEQMAEFYGRALSGSSHVASAHAPHQYERLGGSTADGGAPEGGKSA